MIEYLLKYPDKILTPLLEHLEITVITLFFSLILSIILMIISVKFESIENFLLQLFSVIYSIPSLSIFALLVPLFGLGKVSAIIVLTIYNQFILLRNFLAGINEVKPGILEAARGMGMSDIQRLWKVQIPLSKRSIFSGIRLASVSTIGIGTIAATINAGGLGKLLFDGLRTMNTTKILWGSLLSALLAIMINFVLKKLEDRYEVNM